MTSSGPLATPSATPPPPPPQPSALPPSMSDPTSESQPSDPTDSTSTTSSGVKPARKPLLRLEVRDLSSPGSRAFLQVINASLALEGAVNIVLQWLYSGLEHCIPGTRSVTLVLREMDGVAFTRGSHLDNDHKEIHISTSYIAQVDQTRLRHEVVGVIVHEMVHCWQHNGHGSAPGGLIEGIADWVRLKALYAPPHWRRHTEGDWDSGYERTAYFLEWLEFKHGRDIVRRINEKLQASVYEEDTFWHDCCGKSIGILWEEYRAHYKEASEGAEPGGRKLGAEDLINGTGIEAEWPPPPNAAPVPAWLVQACEELKKIDRDDHFEPIICYVIVDEKSNEQHFKLENFLGAPLPPDHKAMYVPRIRCLDCPGKLYKVGPGLTVDNFAIHLKNIYHWSFVQHRLERTRLGIKREGTEEEKIKREGMEEEKTAELRN